MPETVIHGRFKLRSVPGASPPRFVGTLIFNALPYELTAEVEVDGQGKLVSGSVSHTGPTLEEEAQDAPAFTSAMSHEPRERRR